MTLGQAGKKRAAQREESLLGAKWLEIINTVSANKKQ